VSAGPRSIRQTWRLRAIRPVITAALLEADVAGVDVKALVAGLKSAT
jgi:hypothetical protein